MPKFNIICQDVEIAQTYPVGFNLDLQTARRRCSLHLKRFPRDTLILEDAATHTILLVIGRGAQGLLT